MTVCSWSNLKVSLHYNGGVIDLTVTLALVPSVTLLGFNLLLHWELCVGLRGIDLFFPANSPGPFWLMLP